MEAEIGDAAGAIWQYLDEHGVTTLSKLRQGTKLPDQLLLLGVGWLAREGKLRLVREGRTVRVDLRERGPAGPSGLSQSSRRPSSRSSPRPSPTVLLT